MQLDWFRSRDNEIQIVDERVLKLPYGRFVTSTRHCHNFSLSQVDETTLTIEYFSFLIQLLLIKMSDDTPSQAMMVMLAPDGYYTYLNIPKPRPGAESKEAEVDLDLVKRNYRKLSIRVRRIVVLPILGFWP